jgi:hypothetical protein
MEMSKASADSSIGILRAIFHTGFNQTLRFRILRQESAGPQVVNGHFNNPQATAETLTA